MTSQIYPIRYQYMIFQYFHIILHNIQNLLPRCHFTFSMINTFICFGIFSRHFSIKGARLLQWLIVLSVALWMVHFLCTVDFYDKYLVLDFERIQSL